MPYVSLSAVNTAPESAVDHAFLHAKKYQRYELCLSFVQKLIGDFHPAIYSQETENLFHSLGQVACCIDTHLDALSLSQKEELLLAFPAFFDQLPKGNETAFSWHLSSLCLHLGTSLYPPAASKTLYAFYEYCREKDLLNALKSFSLTVIQAGVDKANARDASAILASLHQEGSAAIEFLFRLLEKLTGLNRHDRAYARLKTYLTRLESMLNIADDLGDHRKDRMNGTIQVQPNARFFYTLGKKLLFTFFATLFTQPLRFPKHFLIFTWRYIGSEMGKSVNCTHARFPLPAGSERETA